MLANELKCFCSVLLHYKVNLECFSGEVVRDILDRRLSKKMCAEFANFIRAKGFIDETAEYLPRLLKWVGDKIIFWQTDLGSNLVQSNNKNIGVKRSLAVTANSEKKHTLISITKNFKLIIKMVTICIIGLILRNRDVFFVDRGDINHFLIVKGSNVLV